MELTPQLFRDVEFTERRGAYDKDEVNAFLARVGTAVGQMQERVREAQRRVEAAEEQVSRLQANAAKDEDEAAEGHRLLVMAKRTADAVVKEAKDESEQIVAQARKKADDMIVQAEEAVRRDVGATRDRLEAENRQLEAHRDELRSRIEVLRDHLEGERSRIRGELERLVGVVDDPATLGVAQPPGRDPEPVIVLSESSPAANTAAPADTAPAAPAADATGESGAAAPDDELSHLPPPPEDWEPPAELRGVDSADTSPSARERLASDDRDAGPPTEAHPVVGAGSSFGGSHLEELRRAVSDGATDAESDAAMAAFFDQDDDDEPSRRFGRRR